MSVHINEVLDYLDTHLVCRNADGMDSLLGMLCEAYMRFNNTDSEEIRYLFGDLGQMLDSFSVEEARRMLSTICDLCASHEVVAFSQGVLVGMQLMTEVNWLP